MSEQSNNERRGLLVRLRDYFWVRDFTQESGDLSAESRVAWDRGIDRAAQLLEAARVASDARLFAPALQTYRQSALELIACALLLEEEPPQTHSDERERVTRFLATKRAESLAAPFRDLLMSEPADSWQLPTLELARRCERFDRALERWLHEMPQRTTAQIRSARGLRISTAGLVLALVLMAPTLWRYFPKNLSYGRSVTASSVQPGKNPAGLVDDVYTGFAPFISEKEAQPWVMIDLGQVYLLTYAKVSGRHDCCFSESVPLVFEVSVDGKNFVQVDQKTDPFVSLTPWVVSDVMEKARYVRLRSNRTTSLALTEVTVYGRAAR